MDADAVLKSVNFYRRAYNSPDAKWSKSREDLAQKATRHNCNLGKLEHTVKCHNTSSFLSVFHISGTSNKLLPWHGANIGGESVEKMIESWCENTGDTEAKRYCDRGYYKNPKAAEVRS